MAISIVLLRGINVGGKHKLKMADLRAALSDAGLVRVETYIQSGNLVVESKWSAKRLEAMVRSVIETHWQYEVPTMVLAAKELKQLFDANPFADRDERHVHLTLLKRNPPQTKIDQMSSVETGDDQWVLAGRAVYLWCPNGYSKTKLHNSFFETRLGIEATTRNWRTISKLVHLAHN